MTNDLTLRMFMVTLVTLVTIDNNWKQMYNKGLVKSIMVQQYNGAFRSVIVNEEMTIEK